MSPVSDASDESPEFDDFSELDDPALFAWRAETRAKLERLPPTSPDYAALAARYERSTEEFDDRARQAWSKAIKEEC